MWVLSVFSLSYICIIHIYLFQGISKLWDIYSQEYLKTGTHKKNSQPCLGTCLSFSSSAKRPGSESVLLTVFIQAH